MHRHGILFISCMTLWSVFQNLITVWIDNGVSIDIWLLQGGALFGSHSFPCRSLLLSTTVLNDIY